MAKTEKVTFDTTTQKKNRITYSDGTTRNKTLDGQKCPSCKKKVYFTKNTFFMGLPIKKCIYCNKWMTIDGKCEWFVASPMQKLKYLMRWFFVALGAIAVTAMFYVTFYLIVTEETPAFTLWVPIIGLLLTFAILSIDFIRSFKRKKDKEYLMLLKTSNMYDKDRMEELITKCN